MIVVALLKSEAVSSWTSYGPPPGVEFHEITYGTPEGAQPADSGVAVQFPIVRNSSPDASNMAVPLELLWNPPPQPTPNVLPVKLDDEADILPKAADTLTRAAAIIKDRAKGVVRVEGHTDSKGGDAYNMRLSERRANAVRDWLRTNGGLSRIEFVTKGFGATQPVTPNQKPDGSDDPAGRQKNRRVEIIMTSSPPTRA